MLNSGTIHRRRQSYFHTITLLFEIGEGAQIFEGVGLLGFFVATPSVHSRKTHRETGFVARGFLDAFPAVDGLGCQLNELLWVSLEIIKAATVD
jgi:hypothetical protein